MSDIPDSRARWRRHTPASFALLVILFSGGAEAQGIQGPLGENRYCATYDDGSEPDCIFSSFASCQAAVSGVGGFCETNVRLPGQYLPPGPQLFPQDPLGLYRDRSHDLPPVPPPPGE